MFGFLFEIFPILFFLVFAFVIGTFITVGVRSFRQWDSDNKSPRLTVEAAVIAKRTQVGSHRGSSRMRHHHTNYFATFQVESGDRMELEVPGNAFGLMVEGDRGKVTFQGKRFLNFERI